MNIWHTETKAHSLKALSNLTPIHMFGCQSSNTQTTNTCTHTHVILVKSVQTTYLFKVTCNAEEK